MKIIGLDVEKPKQWEWLLVTLLGLQLWGLVFKSNEDQEEFGFEGVLVRLVAEYKVDKFVIGLP